MQTTIRPAALIAVLLVFTACACLKTDPPPGCAPSTWLEQRGCKEDHSGRWTFPECCGRPKHK